MISVKLETDMATMVIIWQILTLLIVKITGNFWKISTFTSDRDGGGLVGGTLGDLSDLLPYPGV